MPTDDSQPKAMRVFGTAALFQSCVVSFMVYKGIFCLFGMCIVLSAAGLVRQACSQPLKKITVSSIRGLRSALRNVLPGTVIAVAPGLYKRGIFLKDIHGRPEAPIIISSADPEISPVFQGGGEGAKLSGCSYIKLRGLTFIGFSENGINIDDAGKNRIPSHHIILDRITIMDTGPKGNHDALKMSGIDNFVIRNCRFQGWGGSAIDLVGCHNAVIEDCHLVGKKGFRSANGIQIKGGSCSILVQNSMFHNAGWRAVSIGGSTGRRYFRPEPMGYEAKGIIVAGNIFVGSEAQIAWVTSLDSHVHHNLFYLPQKWVGKILQETRKPEFAPCQAGLFENNVVVMGDRVKVLFNVGPRTNPRSFIFRKNAWDRPYGFVKPRLPSREKDGVYNVDPDIKIVKGGRPQVTSHDPGLRGLGPGGYSPRKFGAEFGDVVVPPVLIPQSFR